jgi:hypothetical protein
VSTLSVRCVGKSGVREKYNIPKADDPKSPPILTHTSTYFKNVGRVKDTRVYSLQKLHSGHIIDGPALIIDQNRYRVSLFYCNLLLCSTIVVEDKCVATITEDGCVHIKVIC